MSNFDAKRALLRKPDLFRRFTVRGEGVPLRDVALDGRKQLLILERNSSRTALIRDQMHYHHLAQGKLAGEPYLVSF